MGTDFGASGFVSGAGMEVFGLVSGASEAYSGAVGAPGADSGTAVFGSVSGAYTYSLAFATSEGTD
jgi:hypothetical protein